MPLEISADAAEQGANRMAAATGPVARAELAVTARQSTQTSIAGAGTQNRSAPAASARQHGMVGAKAPAFLDDRQWKSAVGARRPGSKASARAAPAVLPVPAGARRATQAQPMTAHGSMEQRCGNGTFSFRNVIHLPLMLHVACMSTATLATASSGPGHASDRWPGVNDFALLHESLRFVCSGTSRKRTAHNERTDEAHRKEATASDAMQDSEALSVRSVMRCRPSCGSQMLNLHGALHGALHVKVACPSTIASHLPRTVIMPNLT